MNTEKELEQLKKRLLDLAGRADEQRIYTNSQFLSPEEQSSFLSVRSALPPVSARLWGGGDSCIRKIAVFGSEEDFGYPWESPICVLHVTPKAEKFASELSHRDYLGAMMALGIDRGLTGDIIVRGKEAWIYVLESIVPYLTENLTQAGHNALSCSVVTGDVPELAPRFRNIPANIASERLDLIVSAAAGISRENVKKLLHDHRIFLNEREENSPGRKVKDGDVLVIRGHGKYIYDGVGATTRKGRLQVTIRKYE